MEARYAIGIDFGTEAVRVVAARIRDGLIVAHTIHAYPHGVIDRELPTSLETLPPDYALQDPRDWLDSAAAACRQVLADGQIKPADVVGIGVDFTSCTMLPCRADGSPLCTVAPFDRVALAWPKLWRHHAARSEADRINQVARERNEPWLARYGGAISLEWFFPKVLETLNHAPQIADAAEVWMEAGDWMVWQLISGPWPHCKTADIVRSTCQAGYKAMWNAATGYPSAEYFAAVDLRLADVIRGRMPGTLQSPFQRAGRLTAKAAELLGLEEATPVATAIIDAHAGVPGAGVAEAGTMVMVISTSACQLINSATERFVPGVAGVVQDGILPGYFGYETGQASVGDAFAWLINTFGVSHDQMVDRAQALAPGSGGIVALDWLNGCRTPLMDGRLSGAFIGLTLNTTPQQFYRALIEATAFGLRWIVQTLRDAHISIERLVATGGLPAKSPLLMQIYADMLGQEIRVTPSEHAVALGAASLGCIAAGTESSGHAGLADVIHCMAGQKDGPTYRPRPDMTAQYERIYSLYRALVQNPELTRCMRELRQPPAATRN